MDNSKLSNYQNPEGTLNERKKWTPRTASIRLAKLDWMTDIVQNRSVLDIGCNNGFFTREAMRRGAKRAVGVDVSDCVKGARELAREEGVKAEFWQMDVDSKEFRRFCPKFDVVFLFSVITHLRDKEEFLDWLDGIVGSVLVFESNHGEKNKAHIELVKKHIQFERGITYLGTTDTPEKPHHMWICERGLHERRYSFLQNLPVEFVSLEDIQGWDEQSIIEQKGGYPLDSERFKLLVEDIKNRGVRMPIVLQERAGVLFGFQGAHRYFAAKRLGYKSIPAKVIRGMRFEHLGQ